MNIRTQHRPNWAHQFAQYLMYAGAIVCLQSGGGAYANANAEESLDCLIEPHLVVDLSSPEIGVLGSVRVDEADVVRTGDILAALRDEVERAALKLSRARAASKAEIELLQHDHEFNTRKRNRIDQLQDKHAVSTQSADEVRTAEDLARLRLRAANEKHRTVQLEASRDALALERRTVRSPINGIVTKRYKSAGEYVDGDPIIQLVQLDPLRVRVVAPIEMFGQISVGMKASVIPELPIDGSFEASVISIDPVMDAATATFGVRLSLPNPEQRLPPGLKCTLTLHTPSVTGPDTRQADLQPAAEALKPAPDATPVSELFSTATVANQALSDQQDEDLHSDQCATLGPIGSDREAETLIAKLAANEISSERRYTGNASMDASWIVISIAERVSPDSLLKQVKKAQIADYQLLARGTWKNRISFGTYQGRQSAMRRLQQIKRLGFDVELLNRNNANSKIWLDLTRVLTSPPFTVLVDAMRDDHPTLTMQPVPCTQLASR